MCNAICYCRSHDQKLVDYKFTRGMRSGSEQRRTFNDEDFLLIVKMLYWLIPYLVAFNSTENWTHGPEYLFKADIEAGFQIENNFTATTDYKLDISCRPVNESSIRCRAESLEIKDIESFENDPDKEKKEVQRETDITNWNFEVQYNRRGLQSIVFTNTEELDLRRKVIGAIFDAINISSDFVSGLEVGTRVLSEEVSSIGVCEAKVHVDANSGVEPPPERVDIYMDVPSFTKRSGNDTLLIVTERNPLLCSATPPNFFSNHPQKDDDMIYNVTVSETVLFFGRHSFGGALSNLGRLTMKDPSDVTKSTTGLVKHITRVRLEAVRGAPEKL